MGTDSVDQTAMTAADKAYSQIREKIINLDLSPGSVIREADLMIDLDLGRTPIREALKLLQAENLVIVKPRRGMFVAGISITDLSQIYEFRLELEGLAGRLAAQRIAPAHLQVFDELLDEYRQANIQSMKPLFALDRRFHRCLWEASGNLLLAQNQKNSTIYLFGFGI